MDIPEIDVRVLLGRHGAARSAELDRVRTAAVDVGFMTVVGTAVTAAEVERVLDAYRRFFLSPTALKRRCDMAATGSNRGWGAPGAEQVDPGANPDFKEVFDSGPELAADDPLTALAYYAPNRWPEEPADFRGIVTAYYERASAVALKLLSAVAEAIGEPAERFDDAFERPMALLRGNYYPPRPDHAGEADFGIAPHTDYGCLTLLATDGSPGLEVRGREGGWVPVTVAPGTFVVNFGEMLEHWSGGRIVATPHRVIGGTRERLSVPLFFNPRHDVDVSPAGSEETWLAGDHLARRYDETYVHRRGAMAHPA